jgi:hypothetical protein
VLHALKTMAKSHDYKAAKDRENYLMMTGDLVKTTKLEAALRKMGIAKEDLVDMSDAELDQLSASIKNQMSTRDQASSDSEAQK